MRARASFARSSPASATELPDSREPASTIGNAADRVVVHALASHHLGNVVVFRSGFGRAAAEYDALIRWSEVCAAATPELAARLLRKAGRPADPRTRAVEIVVAAAQHERARATARALQLSREWLGPAVLGGANQILSRAELLRALAPVGEDLEVAAAIRAVEAAPAPEIAMPEGDQL